MHENASDSLCAGAWRIALSVLTAAGILSFSATTAVTGRHELFAREVALRINGILIFLFHSVTGRGGAEDERHRSFAAARLGDEDAFACRKIHTGTHIVRYVQRLASIARPLLTSSLFTTRFKIYQVHGGQQPENKPPLSPAAAAMEAARYATRESTVSSLRTRKRWGRARDVRTC